MSADYIVIGSGSAGCVIAARLSEAGHRVLLLEAGGRDTSPLIHIPAGVGHLLYNGQYNWMNASQPEASTGFRPIHTPRGKVLGGSSSINGMLYVRGNRADYDHWAQLGCTGWGYDDVLPLFRSSESYSGEGDAPYRGRAGPLRVEDYRTILPLTHLFVRAAQEAGFTLTADYNGACQEGVGYSQLTRRGRFRGSTFRTFLAGSAGQNVEIVTHAHVVSLIVKDRKCVGVRYVRQGATFEARAKHEIILSAGAIGSPQILQLSGIGDADHLRSIGIAPVLQSRDVGRNLADHYVTRLVARVKGVSSINELARWPLLGRELLRYVLLGNGALTFGVTSAMVFCRSRDDAANPDLQLLFTPASYVVGRSLVLERQPGMTLAICPTRPRSRGDVLIASTNPFDAPTIRYRYLSDRDDVRVMARGLEIGRSIFSSRSLSKHVVEELRPGNSVSEYPEVEQFARSEGSSLYHPCGTCRMGNDEHAVVDSRLRFRGLQNLRVADASIMPAPLTGNTNAPTIMIGERAAEMILQDGRSSLEGV